MPTTSTPSIAPGSAKDNLLAMAPRTTYLSSKEVGQRWSERIKAQSLFSARTTCRSYLDMVKEKLAVVADRGQTPIVAEDRLKQTLQNLGYTPQTGFPTDRHRYGAAGIPPALPGSMTDLSSSRRIQLILDTNVKQARSLGQMATSDNPVFLMTNPAWRLERLGARRKPRGDWKRRWAAAGNACAWKGAARRTMVALKDSPIWNKIGEGAGGFADAIGSPYPPFAFGSGLAWTNVSRKEWQKICKEEGIDDGLAAIAEKAKALKAAQEAEGGEGAYGASALPGTLGRGLAERVSQPFTAPRIAPKAPPPFTPDTSSRDAARSAVDAAVAAMNAAVAQITDFVIAVADRENEAKAELAKWPSVPVAALMSNFSKYRDAAQRAMDDARNRLTATMRYRDEIDKEPLPTDKASQSAYDAAQKRRGDAAGKSANAAQGDVLDARIQSRAAEANVRAVKRKIEDWVKAECAKVEYEARKYLADNGIATDSASDARMHELQKRITDAKAQAKAKFGKVGVA